MNLAVLFSLFSLVAAAFLDLVLKSYAIVLASRGLFIAGAGASWFVLELILLAVTGDKIIIETVSVKYGILTGLSLFTSNIVLLECLSKLDVSLGSTIYRLNTIIVVFLSYLFLGEEFGLFKSIGILLGVFSIILLYRPTNWGGEKLNYFLFLAIFASTARAIYGVVSKSAIDSGADIKTMIFITTFCWIMGGWVYYLLREQALSFSLRMIKFFVLSGTLVFAVINGLTAALTYGDASVVLPIANLSFVLTLILANVFGRESFSFPKIIVIAFAAGSIICLSIT